MSDETLGQHHRLKNTAEFRVVFDQKRSLADQALIVYGRRNGLPYSRLGLAVSRRIGNAVARNQWKRIIRESFRRQRDVLPVGIDFVVIPRRAGTLPEWRDVSRSLLELALRLERKLAERKPGQSRRARNRT